MIKYFCDRCNTPMNESDYKNAPTMPVYESHRPQFGPHNYTLNEHKTLCNKCMEEYYKFIIGVKNNDS